jgi:hypothetical protein
MTEVPCVKCLGHGSYMYDDIHGKICEACCKHDQGWWELTEAYGKENVGKLCCKAGCGYVLGETND